MTVQNTPVSAAAAYEDNPYFYSNRFEASSCASKWMIEYMRDDIGDTSKGFIYYVFDNWGLKLTEWNGPGTKEWKANPYY